MQVAGLEPARCCHRGILSPLRLPVSPRRHTRHIVPPAARPCQGQEARRAAAKNRPRRRQITNTRLLHLLGYFDKIINYCIIIIDCFGFEAHSAYEIPQLENSIYRAAAAGGIAARGLLAATGGAAGPARVR